MYSHCALSVSDHILYIIKCHDSSFLKICKTINYPEIDESDQSGTKALAAQIDIVDIKTDEGLDYGAAHLGAYLWWTIHCKKEIMRLKL